MAGSALTSEVSSKLNLLNDNTYRENCVLPRNRARCALNKEILDFLNEESISGESGGRAVCKYEKSYMNV